MFADVKPICLPDPTQDYDNVSTVVTGWGTNTTDPENTSLPSILQEGNLTTIPNSQCQEFKWENEIAMKFFNMKITDNMICAVNPKEGVCSGDSGGPMITLSKNGTYQQIGIMSWVDQNTFFNIIISKCLLKSPNVFSRVTAQLDWIHKMIQR